MVSSLSALSVEILFRLVPGISSSSDGCLFLEILKTKEKDKKKINKYNTIFLKVTKHRLCGMEATERGLPKRNLIEKVGFLYLSKSKFEK